MIKPSSTVSKDEFPLGAQSRASVAVAGAPVGAGAAGVAVASPSVGVISVTSAVSGGAAWVGVRVGVRPGLPVRVGVRLTAAGDGRASVALAVGVRLGVEVGEGEAVEELVELAVEVTVEVALAVAVGCGVSEGRGRNGVAVDGLTIVGIGATLGVAARLISGRMRAATSTARCSSPPIVRRWAGDRKPPGMP